MNTEENRKDYIEKYQRGDSGWVSSLEFLNLIDFVVKYKLLKGERLKILDLGSGFTSLFARNLAGAENVISIDDSVEYLSKTKDYLRDNGYDSAGVLIWDELDVKKYKEYFNVIIVDGPGNCQSRMRELVKIIELGAKGAIFIFDDAHGDDVWPTFLNRKGYKDFLIENLSGKGKILNSRELTLDSYGRYSLIFTKGID